MKPLYFISNLDGEIHNANDIKNKIISKDLSEIEIVSNGEVIDTCNLWEDLQQLLNVTGYNK